jgi:5-formyltetrahydrofolate cyclo-ligase
MTSWRKQQRTQLLTVRSALTPVQRAEIAQRCLAQIKDLLAQYPPGSLGIYWPIKGELDTRPLAETLLEEGWSLSVPVINNQTRQLDFAQWHPGMPMEKGTWNIPIPSAPRFINPDRLLVPLLGFDEANYRLGYGGGYYDRTLAAWENQPQTIGVGMEIGRLQSIFPEQHDIAMDFIITEAGLQQGKEGI